MKTHCRHNHELTPANTYRSPQGRRICRICKRKEKMDFEKRERGELPPVFRWNTEQKEYLRKAWEDEWPASSIALAINGAFNISITKNAVIGMAHRMHLPSRPSPIRR